MEALALLLAAWIAIVFLEASYWMARLVLRWAPIIALGCTLGWIARLQGAAPLDALVAGVIAGLVARHLLQRGLLHPR